MKKLEFGKQEISDFKAFAGKHTFHWNSPGVTFIRGENQRTKELAANGASKSSLFDAWCWCLFGRTAAGLRNPDVIPWSKSGNPKVSLAIRVDGKSHSVCRTVSPNRLLWDDKDIDQEKLDQALGLNFALATNTILLAQGQPLFFDLPPKDKMALFSDTLQLERWDERSDLASTKKTEAEADAADFQDQLIACDASLKEVEQLLAEAKAAAEKWAGQQRVAKRQSSDSISSLQQQLSKVEDVLGAAQLKEDGASTELKSLRKELLSVSADLNSAKLVVQKAELVVSQAKQQLTTARDELKSLDKAKTCPTCGQPVRPSNLSKHRAGLEQKVQELDAAVKAGVPNKLRSATELLEQRRESTESYISSFDAKREAAQTEIDRLRPEAEALKARLSEAKKSAGRGKEEANPFQAQIKALQGRLGSIKADRLGAEKGLSLASQRAEQYRFWIKGFRDIKLELVEEVLAELEIVSNGMLDDVGLVGWEVRYAIERETKSGTFQRALHVEIHSPDSKGFVRWEAWSGGERQRLKLIGTLALSDVLLAKAGVEANLEILDEPSMYFSPDGIEQLCSYLSDRAKALDKSIFYVDHGALESAHFSNVITVIKDDRGAYIMQD